MQSTPRGDRTHIGIFGRCNVGKSSLLNALTGQDAAIVSSTRGTTTDPVFKTMELLPLGPVVLMDTPGLDDTSLVGRQRVQRTQKVLRRTDIALLVTQGEALSLEEKELLALFEKSNTPYLVVANKQDLWQEPSQQTMSAGESPKDERASRVDLWVSAKTGYHIHALKKALGTLGPAREPTGLLEGLLGPGELAVLVTPIDQGAPQGRLILPQQQTLREALDNHSLAVMTQPQELTCLLKQLTQPPALVIIDSQIFGTVAPLVEDNVPLTSFSILFARRKGILKAAVEGVKALESLALGDSVLICEGCTHHRQCEDIGSVKIPRWLKEYTGKDLKFSFTSSEEFPEDLSPYALVVHCGGCMLGDKEVSSRLRLAQEQGMPMTNYGILISQLHGTLERSLQPFVTAGLE